MIDYEDEYVTIMGTIDFKEIHNLYEAGDSFKDSASELKTVVILSKYTSPGIHVAVEDEDQKPTETDDIIEKGEVIWVENYGSDTLPSSNEEDIVVKQDQVRNRTKVRKLRWRLKVGFLEGISTGKAKKRSLKRCRIFFGVTGI